MKNTPLFNAKIKNILDQLQPGMKNCQETGEQFEIRKEDVAFYRELQVPPPTVTPWVRQRRMLAHSAPPDELFRIKSALSGKEIITNIGPEPSVPVYAEDEWWSEKWDAIDYSIPYDFSKTFFEQFHVLRLRVPHPAKLRGTGNVNSPWAIGGAHMKNCYMVSSGSESENILYSASVFKSRDSVELFFSDYCELGYQLFQCKYCYKSTFLDGCENCINCNFGFDLKNCENCFGCFNLRHKKYCFFNEPLAKDEYEKKIKNINLGSRKELYYWQKKFNEFLEHNAIRENLQLKNSTNVVGDNLVECNSCYNCFDAYKIEVSAHIFRALKVRDSYDIIGGLGVERCIGLCAKDTYNGKYCTEGVFDSSNIEYCELCYNIENCFGCVGLRNKKFCILNRQYTENEYWQLIDKIKCNMLEAGEYGQILPLEYLIYPYNLTWANIIFPLRAEEAKAKKLSWHIEKPAPSNIGIGAKSLPDNIKDADPDIIGKVFICSETNKLFTIIKQEFDFYKKMNLPLPTVHPLVRRQRLYKKLRAPKLTKSNCARCNREIIIRGSVESQIAKNVCSDCYLMIISS